MTSGSRDLLHPREENFYIGRRHHSVSFQGSPASGTLREWGSVWKVADAGEISL